MTSHLHGNRHGTPPRQPLPPRRQRALRRAARVAALTPALVLLGTSGSAFATAPDTWPAAPSVSLLHVLAVFLLIPGALYVVIWSLVYLPSRRKARGYEPGLAWRGEPTWFGGPGGGLEEADGDPAPAVGVGGTDAGRGGASGHW